jgi:hypothetical protein
MPRDSNLESIDSEWHRIKPGDGHTYDELRINLQTLMSTFENIKWVKTDAAFLLWDKLAQTVFWYDNEVE